MLLPLNKLAILLRGMQFYAHHAHNNCAGREFHQDHAWFGDSYPAYEDAYDSIVERMIGRGGKVDGVDLVAKAQDMVAKLPRDPGECNVDFYKAQLKLELALCALVDQMVAGDKLPAGVEQLIGTLADESESRQYKIRQRLASPVAR